MEGEYPSYGWRKRTKPFIEKAKTKRTTKRQPSQTRLPQNPTHLGVYFHNLLSPYLALFRQAHSRSWRKINIVSIASTAGHWCPYFAKCHSTVLLAPTTTSSLRWTNPMSDWTHRCTECVEVSYSTCFKGITQEATTIDA